MPILAAEPDRFPADLFERTAVEPNRAWRVLHSKPRQEKSLARYLQTAGLEYYLPLIARRNRIRGRIVTAHVPLFTSYVFLRADPAERVVALASNRVVQTLEVADQARLWRDLRQIDLLMSSGAPITPEERLAPGDEVEVTSGPLAGLSGTIIRAATGRRFVVKVDFIQQGASVLLDDFALIPAGSVSAVSHE
jgi:transcriptional antiterminator RfaH